MGYIDKLKVTITCDNCGIVEEGSATDRGSGWGGSSWGSLSPFEKFRVVVEHNDRLGPDVKSATCKKCGQPATVEERNVS